MPAPGGWNANGKRVAAFAFKPAGRSIALVAGSGAGEYARCSPCRMVVLALLAELGRELGDANTLRQPPVRLAGGRSGNGRDPDQEPCVEHARHDLGLDAGGMNLDAHARLRGDGQAEEPLASTPHRRAPHRRRSAGTGLLRRQRPAENVVTAILISSSSRRKPCLSATQRRHPDNTSPL